MHLTFKLFDIICDRVKLALAPFFFWQRLECEYGGVVAVRLGVGGISVDGVGVLVHLVEGEHVVAVARVLAHVEHFGQRILLLLNRIHVMFEKRLMPDDVL